MPSKKLFYVLLALILVPILCQAVSTTLVISEFAARGPANASDEFIEIKNISGSAIDLGDYVISYSSAGGSTPSNIVTFTPGTLLGAGKYFLCANSASSTYKPLADATFSSGAADNGQLAIRKASDNSVVDAVAFGTITLYSFGNTDTTLGFTSATPTPSRERKPTTVNNQDTDSNLNDFIVQATPTPTALGVPKLASITQVPFVPNASQSVALTVTAYGTGGNTISKVSVAWSLNTVNQTGIEMTAGASSTFTATIPGQANGSVVRYTITVYDSAANTLGSAGGYIVGTTAIATLRQSDANAVSLYNGLAARAGGVATVASGAISTTSLSVFMQDNSGSFGASGINVYSRLNSLVVAEGNQLVVEGLVTNFNGLLELEVGTTSSYGSLTVTGTTAVPTPILIPSLDLVGEANEGLLVYVADVYSSFTASTTASINAVMYRGGNATETLTMRIYNTTGANTTPPTYPVGVIGVIGQQDYSGPYTEGYQLSPRKTADFVGTLVVSSEDDRGLKPNQVASFSVTGGTGPYTWSIVSSNGASGSLNTATGASVTLTVGAGTGYLYLVVQDAGGLKGSSGYFTITPTSAPLFRELE